MRGFATTEYATKRLVKTGNKSTWQTNAQGFGHFRPMTDEASAINEIQIGKGFELTVDVDIDIDVTDKVIIDGEEYQVNGVQDHKFQGVEFRKAIMTLGVN